MMIDEVDLLISERRRQRSRGAKGVGRREVIALDMNGAVGAPGKRLPDHLRHARGPGRHDHDLAAVLLLEPQRLLERVRVRLVQFPTGVAIPHPGLGLVDANLPLSGDNLLDRDCDFHSYFFISIVPFVPPNPKEFDIAYRMRIGRL
jgi:hypothetical protein